MVATVDEHCEHAVIGSFSATGTVDVHCEQADWLFLCYKACNLIISVKYREDTQWMKILEQQKKVKAI